MAPYIFSGLCCVHSSCDVDDVLIGAKSKSQCLCCVREECCAVDEEHLGVGLVTNPNNDECCKVALYCCAYGCKTPDRLCTITSQLCCLKEAGALPLDKNYQGDLVCSYYCLTCLPTCGCCVEGPDIPALSRPMNDYTNYMIAEPDANEMDRFEDDNVVTAEMVTTEQGLQAQKPVPKIS
jgi:hypothetical protein